VSEDVEVLARHTEGHLQGVPALTRRPVGDGAAWYLATVPDTQSWTRIAEAICAAAGLDLHAGQHADVEIVRRRGENGSWLFVLNHTTEKVTVEVSGTDLVTERVVDGPLTLEPGSCAVIREDSAATGARTRKADA